MEEVNLKHIIHVCSIKNHPIVELPSSLREKYVNGLSSLLAEIGENDSYLKMLSDVWCESIVGHPYVSFQEDSDKVKKALSVQRIKYCLFRMSYSFLFDCYYLIETWDYNKIGRLNILLREKYCKYFLKKSHHTIHNFYTHNIESKKIPEILIEHRRQNLRFENKPLKRVLVVANISSGKSTLINALVGRNVCKSANMACTDTLKYIYNKCNSDGFSVVNQGNGTIGYYSQYENCFFSINHVAFHFNSTMSDASICLIDTPGANNSEIHKHREITTNAIVQNNYDLLLFVSNGRYYGTTDDKKLLDIIVNECKKPVVFVLNQLDTFNPKEDSIDRMLSYFRSDLQKIGIREPVLCPVSATAAFLMKQSEVSLDEEDKEDLARYKERFSRPFFDLPSFITHIKSENALEATGIYYLEKIIKSI